MAGLCGGLAGSGAAFSRHGGKMSAAAEASGRRTAVVGSQPLDHTGKARLDVGRVALILTVEDFVPRSESVPDERPTLLFRTGSIAATDAFAERLRGAVERPGEVDRRIPHA